VYQQAVKRSILIGPTATHIQADPANRLGEHAMEQAETAAALAWCALEREYPHEKLRGAWPDVLFAVARKL
jgi:alpha-mannosidase